MSADVATTLPTWSTTRSSNQPQGTTTVATNWDDNLREIQGVVRAWLSSKGADIASAGTTDLGAIEGLAHDITGTTTITSFGTISAGIWKILKFEGVLTLTHNATSLILPGGVSVTTDDGDIGIFISEGSGNWRCVDFSRASGVPVVGTQTANTIFAGPASGAAAAPTFRAIVGADGFSLVLIQAQAASNSAQIDFATGITSTYDEYVISVTDYVPATNASQLSLRISQDSGSTFKSAGTDYKFTRNTVTDAGTNNPVGSTGASSMLTTPTLSNTAANSMSGSIRFSAPAGTASYKKFRWDFSCVDSAGNFDLITGGGAYVTDASAINGVRILSSSGNITSGNFVLYGVRKS